MHNLKWILQPLSAFALGMLFVLNLTLYLFWYLPGKANLDSSIDQLGASLVRTLSFEATSALYNSDRAALSNLLNRYAEEPMVASARVLAEESGIQLSSRTKTEIYDAVRPFQLPIHFSDALLGYAEIDLSESQLSQWQAQAITSWVLFNILSLSGLGAFIFFRTQKHEKTWQKISKQLHTQMPDLASKMSGSPEHQFEQLLDMLDQPVAKQGKLLKHIRTDSLTDDTERLIEQVELVSNQGSYNEVALVAIQCQNWESLIREYDATELQTMWSEYESLMIRVSELYNGILLPDGFSLAFGLHGEEQFAFNALCTARVLQLALENMSQSRRTLAPRFGIAVSAGPAFVSKTHKHGIPLPLITGDAEVWLAQIKAIQPLDQVLIAEPFLQYQEVNQQIIASVFQDITMRDGHRLEVWELDGLKTNDDLLKTQADTLVKTNR